MTDTRLTEDKERSPCIENEERGLPRRWATRMIALDVLMACWGMGTWLGVNGLFVQLPLLVTRQPESWGLASHMTLAVQCGNVSPLLYAAARRLCPRAPDRFYIAGLLALAAAALFLNAFLYGTTAELWGAQRSVVFLAVTLAVALVGCASSVLFYPYLRHFRDIYLTTYLVGEGLSGLVPSVLALVQGVGPDSTNDPSSVRFDTTVFMLILSGLAALSLASFVCLNASSRFRSERVMPAAAAKAEEATCEPVVLVSVRWAGVLALTFAINALSNGVLPSVQPYSCLPYGARVYHVATCLGAMAAPAACLAGVWLRPAPPRALAALLLLALTPLCYMLTTAALSPLPPLQRLPEGVALIVTCWVFVTSVLSYTRMWVYGWARGGGARGMRACGAATQLGSATGSLLLFLLINVFHLFKHGNAATPVLTTVATETTLAPPL